MTDINDIGLQLSAMLNEGKRLTPAVAKMLHRSLGQKGFNIEETGDGGVQVTMDGQVVAGPFYSEDEVQAAIQELQSGMQRGYNPVTKGWINWGLMLGGLASGNLVMWGAGFAGELISVLLKVADIVSEAGDERSRQEQDQVYGRNRE